MKRFRPFLIQTLPLICIVMKVYEGMIPDCHNWQRQGVDGGLVVPETCWVDFSVLVGEAGNYSHARLRSGVTRRSRSLQGFQRSLCAC
jgi:hypothetical protein